LAQAGCKLSCLQPRLVGSNNSHLGEFPNVYSLGGLTACTKPWRSFK